MTFEQQKLKEHFLEPETRCDFYVSAERKAVWKALLDMLEVFIGVCNKYGFRYYVDGGTMLGAIRHQGFIPWDDDIDVVMFRDDYDKLQEVLPKELPSHLFMQTELTDPEYPVGHIKIRNSLTTGIGVFQANRKMRFNMGLFLDIFPLDGVPDDERERAKFRKQVKFFTSLRRNVFWHKFGSPIDLLKFLYARVFWLLLGNAGIYKWQERVCRKHDYANCKEGATCVTFFGIERRNCLRHEWIDEQRDAQFEYLTVKVPARVEDVLTNIYGDWHKLVRGTAQHGEIILDANRCYKDVLVTDFGYREEWTK